MAHTYRKGRMLVTETWPWGDSIIRVRVTAYTLHNTKGWKKQKRTTQYGRSRNPIHLVRPTLRREWIG